MTIRLWHQSSTALGSENYRHMLLAHSKVVAPEIEVVLHGVAPGTWPTGDARRGIYECEYTNMLIQLQCARNAIQAEDEGFDAFGFSCFEDPGMHEARSMVDIPVVGLMESSILLGQSLGRSLALIGSSASQANRIANIAHRTRLDDRVVCVLGVDRDAITGGLDGAQDGGASAIRAFESAARVAISRGADVLIPGEGILNVLLAEKGITEIDGVRVIDSWAAVLNFAQVLVQMHRSAGTGVSRSIDYGKVDRKVAHHMAKYTADMLVTGVADFTYS